MIDIPTPVNDKKQLSPGLYLVATPIGNLKDITLRALETLHSVDLIACEDTRVTAKLLCAYNIGVPKISYHDHNAAQRIPDFIRKIQEGKTIALVSDAGMPLISDPGYKLVQACQEHGVYVTSMPGASAVLTGLQLSGLPSDSFTFAGFLPTKTTARKKMLAEYKDIPGTLIYYESASRLSKMLADVQSVLGDRKVAVARELTKRFEEVICGSVEEVLDKIDAVKGEIVVVIGSDVDDKQSYSDEDVERLLQEAMETMSVKDASATIALETGLAKRDIYARALELQRR